MNQQHRAARWSLIALAGVAIVAVLSALPGRVAAQASPVQGPAGGQTITITPDDNGQTFHIQTGDRVVVKMGTDLNWTVDVDPPGILVPVPGVGTLVRGVQGIYAAVQPGTVTLTATGRPNCSGDQACPEFIQQVQVTIVVGPPPVSPTPIVGCFPAGDPPHIVCA
jgi:hypothetical protein